MNLNETVCDFLRDYNLHDTAYDELDMDITSEEIVLAIKNLNTNKACGIDGILNKYLINCKNVLVPSLVELFNNVSMSGYFPTYWSTGSIVTTIEGLH